MSYSSYSIDGHEFVDPSLTNQNLLALCPSCWVSSTKSDNPEIILQQIRSVLQKFYSKEIVSVPELFEVFSSSFQTYEANWIYRYHKRFLWHIAEQCNILFPNYISGQTRYAVAKYMSENAPNNVLPDFKERVVNIMNDVDANENQIWYLIIVYVICRYQTTDYKTIMSLLRGKENFKDNELWYYHSQIMSKLMYFTPRSHRDMFVFRGTSVWNQEYADVINKAISIGVMETREYLSSSRSIYKAETFYTNPNPRTGKYSKHNVLFIYELPKGFPIMLFESQFEEEILLPPCVKWHVTYLGTHQQEYEEYEENHRRPKGYKLTILHCKPLDIKTFGYVIPTNDYDELMLKLKLSVDIAKFALNLIAPKTSGISKEHEGMYREYQTNPMYGCYSAPPNISLIKPEKSIPPPSNEWRNLDVEFQYNGPLTVRPPEHNSYYDMLWEPSTLEYTDIRTGNKHITKEYEDVLLKLLENEIANGRPPHVLAIRFGFNGAQFFYDFLKKHYPM